MATFGIIIDVAVVLALVIFGCIGFKKGLLKSVLSLFSWIVCLIISVWLAKYVANLINGIYDFSALFGNKISKSLIASNEFFGQSINVFEAGGKDSLIAAMPKDNKFIAQIAEIIFSNSNVDMSSSATIGSVLGLSLGHICMIVISGVLVFIVLKIVIGLLTKFINKIEQTKVLGGLNKLLGLALGLIKASVIILIINGLLIALTMIPKANKIITPAITENTYVEKVIYQQTDKWFEKYVIEGDVVKNVMNKLWQNRNS